jgi:hypothetical protein
MRLSVLFLLLSLIANGVGAWLLLRDTTPAEAALPVRPGTDASTMRGGKPLPGNRAAPDRAAPRNRVEYFVAQRDRLRALGFGEDVVRRAIRAAMEEPRYARQREFYAQAAQQPWWHGGLVYQDITKEQQRELSELRKSEREEVMQVLGPTAYLGEASLERFSFLSPEKAERLALLEQDYNDLRRESGQPGTNAEERQKLLTAEYERDLAALLTPAERALFDERESSTARNVASRFEFFDGTEAEYRAVLALQKAFDDQFAGTSMSDSMQARGAAMAKLTQDLRETLGLDRYEQFLQAQRSEYRALLELQRRHALPQPVFAQAARVHAEISRETTRIADDTTLTNAQKRAALIELSGKATAGIQSALGSPLAETFIAATRASWIDVLARGGAYAAQPTGGSSTRMFNDRPPAPPPAPPKS